MKLVPALTGIYTTAGLIERGGGTTVTVAWLVAFTLSVTVTVSVSGLDGAVYTPVVVIIEPEPEAE